MRTKVTVNGQPFDGDVEPRTLLVEMLRDELGLTGTKIGCDTGQCGACVVHLDGTSVRSCEVLAVQADGASVTTIEGLTVNGGLNRLQQALWETHGVQCGFCTPGMVMTLTDLLEHSPEPSESEIRCSLTGNLCRCTGYQSVVRAVQQLVDGSRSESESTAVA
jgi:aerobic carbon-monoxide dehydrogenase small subunit